MGPRLFSRGKLLVRLEATAHPSRASMGPRLFSRGKPSKIGLYYIVHCASMGPRLFSRGKCGSGRLL